MAQTGDAVHEPHLVSRPESSCMVYRHSPAVWPPAVQAPRTAVRRTSGKRVIVAAGQRVRKYRGSGTVRREYGIFLMIPATGCAWFRWLLDA